MAAGEGYLRLRATSGGPLLTDLQLSRDQSQTWYFVFTVGASGMQGYGAGAGGGLKFFLHVGGASKPSMFFEGLTPTNIVVTKAGSLALGRVSVAVVRDGLQYGLADPNGCGGSGQAPCYSVKIAPLAGYNLAAGDTIEFHYTGRTSKISTQFGAGMRHRIHIASRSNYQEAYTDLPELRETVPGEPDCPSIYIPGSDTAAKLFIATPSDLEWLDGESEPFDVAVVAVDNQGQVAQAFAGSVDLSGNTGISGLPGSFTFNPAVDNGIKVIRGVKLTANPGAGFYQVTGSSGAVTSMAKVAKIHATAPAYRRSWGNIHCHTRDGGDGGDHCGKYVRFEQAHGFMEHAARLDFGGVSDHDCCPDGTDVFPATNWAAQKAALRLINDGSYHGFLIYELTETVSGHFEHCNVMQFIEPSAEVADCGQNDVEQVGPLLGKLGPVLLMPHIHVSANTTWQDYADNGFRRLVEWFSNKNPTGDATYFEGDSAFPAAYTIRNAWANRHLVGVYGSADEHNGCSGMRMFPGVDSVMLGEVGGIACVLAESGNGVDIWNALINRRCYATTGARIWLNFTLNGNPMGSILPLWNVASGAMTINIEAIGDYLLDYVKLFKYDAQRPDLGWQSVFLSGAGPGIGQMTYNISLASETKPSAYSLYYVRVKQMDEGGVAHYACTSPIFLVDR